MFERKLQHDTPYVSENDWTVSDAVHEPAPTEKLLTWSEYLATHDQPNETNEFYDAMSHAAYLAKETTLTPDEAEVYVLHETHSWPITTIVTVLAITKTTAKELLETATSKLHDQPHRERVTA